MLTPVQSSLRTYGDGDIEARTKEGKVSDSAMLFSRSRLTRTQQSTRVADTIHVRGRRQGGFHLSNSTRAFRLPHVTQKVRNE